MNKPFFVPAIVLIMGFVMFLFYQKFKQPDLVFKEDFVIEMFDKNKNLTEELQALSTDKLINDKTMRDVKSELVKIEAEKNAQLEQNHLCESQKSALIESIDHDNQDKEGVSAMNTPQQCDEKSQQLALLTAEVESFKKQLAINRNEYKQLLAENAALDNAKLSLVARVGSLEKERELILSEATQIRDDLTQPIHLKNVFITPKFCHNADSENTICLDSVLVLPQFSKMPYTKVMMKLFDPNQNKIGSLNYNVQDNKITQFELKNRKQFSTGEFTVEIEVDNQTLNYRQIIDKNAKS